MKKQLLLFLCTILLSNFAKAQSISFTSTELTTAQIGSTITVNFQYTIPSDGYIYCAINLLNDWTWTAMVASAELNPAVAGTNMAGSFQLTIPEATTPTANLTGNMNYKISIELKDSGFNWLAGAYPATQINLTTASLSTSDYEKNRISIYPNPVNNEIQLKGIENTKISDVSIVNILGKKVYASSKLSNSKIDVSQLNSGIYFLTFISDNLQKSLKFIKK